MLAESIYQFIDTIAPFSLQEPWDNSGLQVGSLKSSVHRVLLALDATAEIVEEAKAKHCDMLVTHHPFLFKAQKQFIDRNPAYLAAKYGMTVISAHTSYDAAQNGVQDILAKDIGLSDVRIAEDGLLRLGETKQNTVLDLAKQTKTALAAQVLCSLPQKEIHTVALCSGAGGDLWEEALQNGADVFLTGEMKHHEVLDAAEKGLAVILAGHFETEIHAVEVLKTRLEEAFPEVEFCLSDATSPLQYIE